MPQLDTNKLKKIFFSKLFTLIKNNLLLILIIISVIVGVIIGILVRIYATLSSIEKSYFSFPGEIFLRVLKLLIFPLILSSLITSMGNIVKTKSG